MVVVAALLTIGLLVHQQHRYVRPVPAKGVGRSPSRQSLIENKGSGEYRGVTGASSSSEAVAVGSEEDVKNYDPNKVDSGISMALFSADLDPERYYDEYKMAADTSVFAYIRESLLRTQMGQASSAESYKSWSQAHRKQEYIVNNWESSTLSDRCKVLVTAMYKKDPMWNHTSLTEEFGERGDSNPSLIKAIERLRIYNQCFINGEVGSEEFFEDLRTEFNMLITAEDFQARMFPFLRKMPVETTEHMIPRVVNMRTGLMDDTLAEGIENVTPYEFNTNFFQHWRQMAKGRGIVTTMAPHQIPLLRQQFRIWKELNNTLPIQITYKNKELDDKHKAEIESIARDTDQEVYLVNMQTVLDDYESKHKLHGFTNKFLATIFNTFEEFIFIDADAVSFVNPIEYFEMRSFKRSGMRMWRDRHMNHLGHDDYCNDILIDIVPSFEEHLFIGSNWDLLPTDPEVKTSSDPKALLFREYFDRNLLHHAESGLFVVRKSDKLAGLVAALFLNKHWGYNSCSYGDKEAFWVGPLVMGMDFYLDKAGAAALGKIVDMQTPKGENAKAICSTQLAHVDDDMRLVWTNGGLRNCKFDDGAKYDYEKKKEYFSTKFGSEEELDKMYRSRLEVDGFIIPDGEDIPWQPANECKGYVHCALAVPGDVAHNVYMDAFEPEERTTINHLVQLYNEAASA